VVRRSLRLFAVDLYYTGCTCGRTHRAAFAGLANLAIALLATWHTASAPERYRARGLRSLDVGLARCRARAIFRRIRSSRTTPDVTTGSRDDRALERPLAISDAWSSELNLRELLEGQLGHRGSESVLDVVPSARRLARWLRPAHLVGERVQRQLVIVTRDRRFPCSPTSSS